jgi:glucose/arabinose dehydrogenase
MKHLWMTASGLLSLAAAAWILQAADKIDNRNLITGKSAFVDAKDLKPGTFRKITANDLPSPGKGTPNFGKMVPRPENLMPQALPGFKVELYVGEGLSVPRQIRMAPNGDLFVAESGTSNTPGEIKVFRGNKDGKPEQVSTFADSLKQPFGIAFYPVGNNPQWVYVGNTNSVVRFAYKSGDLKAGGPAETIVAELPTGGFHWTRDVVFSKDGKQMFVAVGSADNIDERGQNEHRANILEYTPDGKFVKVYGAGIRNPVGLGINPETGELWCSVNERDDLGDNLVPDYVTSVRDGGFYGWPWYYIGSNPDARVKSSRPELKDKVLVPDVLLQAHNASLGLTFYNGNQFPSEYRGDLFAAEHGSWNRSTRAGHEVIRVPLQKGHASGVYEDFLTGFVTPEGQPWGRPVGVVTGKDGALYVTDDGSKSIWRVSYAGK